nr:Chain A, Nodule Cysteine-Rich (NCR) secreted peptide [Medicago truncatula]7CKE_A Chain A, Nodule Cysteine-Rich (NCR) secreted peptide [Medicago truncatula]
GEDIGHIKYCGIVDDCYKSKKPLFKIWKCVENVCVLWYK